MARERWSPGVPKGADSGTELPQSCLGIERTMCCRFGGSADDATAFDGRRAEARDETQPNCRGGTALQVRQGGDRKVEADSGSEDSAGREHREVSAEGVVSEWRRRRRRSLERHGVSTGCAEDGVVLLESRRRPNGVTRRGELFGANRAHVGFSRMAKRSSDVLREPDGQDGGTTWNGRDPGLWGERKPGNGTKLRLGGIGNGREQSRAQTVWKRRRSARAPARKRKRPGRGERRLASPARSRCGSEL